MITAPQSSVPAVHVHLGSAAPWRGKPPAADGAVYGPRPNDPDPTMVEVWWVDGRDGLVFRYDDGAEFHISADVREIWGTWPAPFTVEDAAVYLLGPVLSYVLRRRSVLTLHASGVVVNEHALAFCGFGGAGKSTLAAAFASAGYGVLSDDVVALGEQNGRLFAFPASNYLRVWDDSARALIGDPQRLPLLTPNWDKRAFPVEALGYVLARNPTPLAGVCILGDREDTADAPRISRLRPAEALIALMPHTSANYLLDENMRATEFAQLTQLVESTSVYRVVPHSDPMRLPELVTRVAALANVVANTGD